MDVVIYGIAFVFLTIIVALLLFKGGGSKDADSGRIQEMLTTARLSRNQSDFTGSILLYEKAIADIESSRNVDQALLSTALNGMAESLERAGSHQQAKQARERMLSIWRQAMSARQVAILTDIDYLAANGDFGSSTREVAQFYEELLAIREKTVAPHSDEFINTVVIYSKLMRTLGEKQIADDLEKHAQKLRKGGSPTIEFSGSDVSSPSNDPEQSS